MDLVRAYRIRETLLLALVVIMALIANLPAALLNSLDLQRAYLLAPLGIIVTVALFLYEKVFVFLLFVLLITGANLPKEWATTFGIDPTALLITLIALVVISVINHLSKLIPNGLEPKPRKKNPEGIKALNYAIDKDNLSYAQQVLNMGYDMNMTGSDGRTPLMRAAAMGQRKMVELLLRNGADSKLLSQDNYTASELALRNGHEVVAEMLRAARQQA